MATIEVGSKVRMSHRYGVATVVRICPPAYVNDYETAGVWQAMIELPHRTPAYRFEWVGLWQLTPAE